MKKGLLAGALLCTVSVFGQTLLYSHNFDGISINSWVNTDGGTGNNIWVTNNSYEGNVSASIVNVPDQPASFTDAPQSYYMHITNMPNCSGFVFVSCNAHYEPNEASNNAIEMLNGISTTGETDVAFKFWYLSQGDGANANGSVEYSIDGGTTWETTGVLLANNPDWTQLSIEISAFDNQADLRFRFRWQNNDTGTGGNLALSIDEIQITSGPTPPPGSISITNPSEDTFCTDTELAVEFTPAGTYNAGNVFSAELSNETGSFVAPTVIGTLTSSSSTVQTINTTIPASATPGTGYRIRVVSSDPVVFGTDNGSDITVEDCALLEEETTSFFRLFPNPAGASVAISYEGNVKVSSIEILDQHGRFIAEVPSTAAAIDLSLLGQGVYLIRVTSEKGVSTQRITKK